MGNNIRVARPILRKVITIGLNELAPSFPAIKAPANKKVAITMSR